MIYLDHFQFASEEQEEKFLASLGRQTCFPTKYPFQIFPKKGWRCVDFSDITIFYGSNGSGKSTALNIIADMVKAHRDTVYNRTNLFESYLIRCEVRFIAQPEKCRIITSDAVFDSMLDVRNLNDGIDEQRGELFNEYWNYKKDPHQDRILKGKNILEDENFARLKRLNAAKKRTRSQFVNKEGEAGIQEYSNGETALRYLQERIDENGIFILDEPENSLAPERQKELVKYIETAARFWGCQFIISTHSPFLLALRDAKIYDLDARPVDVKHWSGLRNIEEYYDFFQEHSYTLERIHGTGKRETRTKKMDALVKRIPSIGSFLDHAEITPGLIRDLLDEIGEEEAATLFASLPLSNPMNRRKNTKKDTTERRVITCVYDLPPDVKDHISRLEQENAMLQSMRDNMEDMIYEIRNGLRDDRKKRIETSNEIHEIYKTVNGTLT